MPEYVGISDFNEVADIIKNSVKTQADQQEVLNKLNETVEQLDTRMTKQNETLRAEYSANNEEIWRYHNPGNAFHGQDPICIATAKQIVDGWRENKNIQFDPKKNAQDLEVAYNALCDAVKNDNNVIRSVTKASAGLLNVAKVNNSWTDDYLIKSESYALSRTEAGQGADLINDAVAAFLWAEAVAASSLLQEIPVQPVETNKTDINLNLKAGQFYAGTSGVVPTESRIRTQTVPLECGEMVAYYLVNEDLVEDSEIPNITSEVVNTIYRAAGDEIDNVLFNADNAPAAADNISSQTAVTVAGAGASPLIILGDLGGIRKRLGIGGAANSFRQQTAGALWTMQELGTAFGNMGDYSVNPQNTIMYMHNMVYNLLRVSEELRRYINFSDGFTNRSGIVTSFQGMRLRPMPSSKLPLVGDAGEVEATAANNVHPMTMLLHVPSFRVGFRRQQIVRSDYGLKTRQFVYVYSTRFGLANRHAVDADGRVGNILIGG